MLCKAKCNSNEDVFFISVLVIICTFWWENGNNLVLKTCCNLQMKTMNRRSLEPGYLGTQSIQLTNLVDVKKHI